MRLALFFIFFQVGFGFSQPTSYIYGNHSKLCITDTIRTEKLQQLNDLDSNDVVFIFSSAGNGFDSKTIDTLIDFVQNGGGLYIGSENWPLQTEANQLTNRLFNKTSFGIYNAEVAERAENGNLALKDVDTIPSGKTSVAFPMDHRLTVEAWVEDQPLILSGSHGQGRIIIDGGYSRFYCDQITTEGKQLLFEIFDFLTGN